MDKIIVYGIPNCDSTKKAMSWLKKKRVDINFHDYKKEGITQKKLTEWCATAGWEKILNKKSTTWRGLTPEEQAKTTNQKAAVQLMQQHSSLVKRPVIEWGSMLLVGFDEKALEKAALK